MVNGQLRSLVRFLQGLTSSPTEGPVTDQRLLERFVKERDEAAFATLLERHGPMVRGVCQRVLGDAGDVDDAFQAAFLVLARKAASVSWHQSVGGWLHEVACRIARKARTTANRDADLTRRLALREVSPMATADPPSDVARRELRSVLDEELALLPEKYRLPLVLCYLEGQTNEEAARQLGWTKGTVSGRLARARDLLRPRLAKRGLALSAATFAVVVCEATSSSTVPRELLESTLRAAVAYASGGTGTVSAKVVTLTEGVLKTMFLTRLNVITAVLLAATLLGAGVTVITYRALAADQNEVQKEPAPKPPVKAEADQEQFQGTWTLTYLEVNGKVDENDKSRLIFKADHCVMEKQGRIANEMTYRLDPTTKPKRIDLIEAGQTRPGIYQLEGDALKVCFAERGETRPGAFATEADSHFVLLVLRREPPAKVTYLETVGGKPPMRTIFVSLELTNTKEQSVWLVNRSDGDRPLVASCKFTAGEFTPQIFGGDGYDGKKGGGKGEAVEVRYTGAFRAFLLPAKATVMFERYPIHCWEDIRQFEVWEVSSLKVNGRTPLEKWLPYPVQNGLDVLIPARTNPANLDWDANTSRSRTDYPKERIEFVNAEVIKKWLLPIAGLGADDKAPR